METSFFFLSLPSVGKYVNYLIGLIIVTHGVKKEGKCSYICMRKGSLFTPQLNNHGCHATTVC